MLTLTCPHCNATVKAPDHLAGETRGCPGCKKPFQIPAPVAEHVPTMELDEPAEPRPPPRWRKKARGHKQRSRFVCPFCGTTRKPDVYESVTTAGYVVMVALLFLCFPVFWLPLIFMKEEVRQCADCDVKLG